MSGNILQGRTLKSTIPTESRLIIPSPISHFIEKKQTTQTFLLQGLSKLLYHLDKDELHCFIRQQQVSSSSLMGQAVLKHTKRHGPLYGPSQRDFQRSASSALSSQGSVQNQEWTRPSGFQHQEEQKWNFQTSPVRVTQSTGKFYASNKRIPKKNVESNHTTKELSCFVFSLIWQKQNTLFI